MNVNPLSCFSGAALAALVMGSAGCVSGPDFKAPPAPESNTYRHESLPQPVPTQPDLPTRWWTLFKCEPLDDLVHQALAGSPTLAQAKARLEQARETLAAETGATLYPTVDAKASASRQQVSLAALGVSSIPDPGPYTLLTAALSVSYTFDWTGRNRRLREGLKAGVDDQVFELAAARQTLVAQVVSAVIRQASLNSEITLLNALLDRQRRHVNITEAQRAAGGASRLDLERQQGLLAQSEALLPEVIRQRDQANRQVAIYLGREPATLAVPAFTLESLRLPSDLPLRMPAELVRQRPDIRAAEALWHRACAAVGVATANQFPQLTVSASLGSQRAHAGDLLKGVNVWDLGGTLVHPVLHGGELRARKREAMAAYDEAAAVYKQAVLHGLQEVADALDALDTSAATLAARREAEAHTHVAHEIACRQFEAGGISGLALLEARRQWQQAELDTLHARTRQYTDTVALLQALGGTW